MSANKTARATFSRGSRDRLRELRAQRLRLIRALRTEFSLDNAIAMPILEGIGELKHRLTVRLTGMRAELLRQVDSAISKTVHVPKDCPIEELQKLHELARDKGLKGCTDFRPNTITGEIMEIGISVAEGSQCCNIEREARQKS